MRRTELGAGAILLLSLVYFFEGFSGLTALLASAFIHELGHIAAIGLFGGSVRELRMDASGLCIGYAGIDGALPELAVLLAGPVCGLALAYAASYFGTRSENVILLKTAGLSLVLTIYNLLPALPLDGGRALACILRSVSSDKTARTVMEISGIASGLALCALGLWLHNALFGSVLFGAGIVVLFAQSGLVKSFGMI